MSVPRPISASQILGQMPVPITPLLQALLDLPRGEARLLKSSKEAPPNERVSVSISGWTDESGELEWRNCPEPMSLPSFFRPQLALPPRPFSSIGVPELIMHGSPDALGDFWGYGEVLLLSEPLFETILALDPESIDWIAVDIRGLPPERRYWMCMARRVIDPIDTAASTVRISYEEIKGAPGYYIREAHFHNAAYTVRRDIPDDVHVFRNVFDANLFFSSELLARLKVRGVTKLGTYKIRL